MLALNLLNDNVININATNSDNKEHWRDEFVKLGLLKQDNIDYASNIDGSELDYEDESYSYNTNITVTIRSTFPPVRLTKDFTKRHNQSRE